MRGLGRSAAGNDSVPADDADSAHEADSIDPTTSSGEKAPLPFDREELMARVDSDVELLSTLVGSFKADHPSLMVAIEEALATEDADALETAAHTIKGALSVFGAVRPTRRCRRRHREGTRCSHGGVGVALPLASPCNTLSPTADPAPSSTPSSQSTKQRDSAREPATAASEVSGA